MKLKHNGLVKLIEECGELCQEAGKAIQYEHDLTNHPDGKGDLNLRLQNEIADVLATLYYVKCKLNLNDDAITDRAHTKLKRFIEWEGV